MNTNNEANSGTAMETRSDRDDRACATRPSTSHPRRSRTWWIWGTLVCGAALAAYLLLPVVTHGQARGATNGRSAAGGRGGRAGSPRVPVVAAVAEAGTMPVYLNGLGTVTSLNTVTVHSRVDGQLIAVMFKEGQIVRQGELLAQIDPRPFQVQLAQAEGTLARDQAALKNAQIDLQRYQALFGQDAIPQQQLATQMATVTQDEGVIKSDEAQVNNAKLNLTYSRITSPITGRVGLRLVDPGNIVHAGDPNGIIVITQRQPIGILFTIPEDSLPPVLAQLHQGRTLGVDAWDRDLNTKLATGTLLTVDNQIDPTTGTVRLKAVFPNQEETLFPNQFVNARLLLDTLKGIVIVPAAAIQRNQQSTFVYVVKPDNAVELRTVDVRLTEGDKVAIDSGLTAGERVVVEGVDKLQPGTRVAATYGSAPNAPSGSSPAPGGNSSSNNQRAHRGNR